MKKTPTLLFTFLLFSTSFVYANENSVIKKDDITTNEPSMYIKFGINRPKVIYNFKDDVKDSYKLNTLSFNASLGLDINKKFSTDITVKTFKDIIDKNETGSTITKKTLSNTLLLTNGYFYIPTNTDEFKPYLTTGIGIAAISSNTTTAVGTSLPTTVKNSNISFAYSAGIGFNTPIWESVFFDMNFKYYDLGELRKENISITTNSFSMGIKILI